MEDKMEDRKEMSWKTFWVIMGLIVVATAFIWYVSRIHGCNTVFVYHGAECRKVVSYPVGGYVSLEQCGPSGEDAYGAVLKSEITKKIVCEG